MDYNETKSHLKNCRMRKLHARMTRANSYVRADLGEDNDVLKFVLGSSRV